MEQSDTRERVLEAACTVFAENGYERTTIATICRKATANIAAVNYYFNNKDSLYQSVWEYARNQTDAAYPPPDPDAGPPEEALRTHIANRLLAIFDPGPSGWFPKILQHEVLNPTERSEELRQQFLYPRMQNLHRILRRLLGPRVSETQLRCCSFNILSLYAFFNVRFRTRHQFFDNQSPTNDQINALIKQMQDFALAGVRNLAASTTEQDS